MAAQAKLVFSKFLSDTDIKMRLAVRQQSRGPCRLSMEVMPSYFSFGTAQDSGQCITLSAGKGTANPFSQVQVEDGSSYYRVEVGREIDFLGINAMAINAMAYGSGSTADVHVITHHRQGLSLELSLGQPNVEGADN